MSAPGTVEDWARAFVQTTDLREKCAPGEPPTTWSPSPRVERLPGPGRPPELRVIAKTSRSLRRAELADPRKRARLLHSLWHHELQAAELFAWAILAFAETPHEFRSGLLRLCNDELRHARAYAGRVVELGSAIGEHPVRDWFWERAMGCTTATMFVAFLGLGLEGGNLDHAQRLAADFVAVGDSESAAVLAMVERDEVEHLRFGVTWFERFTGGLEFDRWRRELVAPLTPSMMRGKVLNRSARSHAGLSGDFLDALESFRAPSPGPSDP